MKYIPSVVAIIFVLTFLSSPASANDSVHKRVTESGKIRCGYALYPPIMYKDPNTGELSGVFYDLAMEIGRRLSLEIEWTMEVTFATFIEDLKNDRIDMMCATAWPNASRGREVTPLSPFFYSSMYGWARYDDNRFTDKIAQANNPDVKVSTYDGSMITLIAEDILPNAEKVALPDIAPTSDVLLNVKNGKADIVFAENQFVKEFNENHERALQRITDPVRVYGNTMWIKKGEPAFASMINLAIDEILLNSNFLENTFEKYGVDKEAYLPPARPYSEKW